jgi:hypothetical protein
MIYNVHDFNLAREIWGLCDNLAREIWGLRPGDQGFLPQTTLQRCIRYGVDFITFTYIIGVAPRKLQSPNEN